MAGSPPGLAGKKILQSEIRMQRRALPWALAAALYFVLTIALTWPLVLSPASIVPNDLGDPLLNTFLIDWNARVLPLTQRWWDLPQFHPIRGTMAFSEHLLGLAPVTTPITWVTGSPVAGYNAAFLLAFVLCGLSAHLLAYVITGRHDVSVLAGIAYAFAPYRMSQLAHVQVLSAYWMPVALAALHLSLEDRRRRWRALFAVSWLMQALACGYYLFFLSVLVGLWLLWFVVRDRRWRDLAALTGAWAVAALAMAPVAWGYLKYQRMYGLRRWPDEIEAFSADIASVLSATDTLRLWGWLRVVQRPESDLFPGLTVVALVLAGLACAWLRMRTQSGGVRLSLVLLAGAAVFALLACIPAVAGPVRLEVLGLRLLSISTARKPMSLAALLAAAAFVAHPAVRGAWRRGSPLAFYTLAAAAMWACSLGPSPTFMNVRVLYKAPYAWLMYLPGMDGVRVPARFWMLATLCLSIAASLGALHVVRRWPRTRAWLPAAACVLLLLEGWPQRIGMPALPAERPIHSSAAARLDLPLSPQHDATALYRATRHRRPVINGYSGYFAPHYWLLWHLLERRDRDVLTRLASLGALEVVVDHQQDPDRTWRRLVGRHQDASVVHKAAEYTAYRVGPLEAMGVPALQGAPLPVHALRASVNEEALAGVTDDDRITRWHTRGPQSPTNEVTIDLGEVRRASAVETEIGGYILDFPRALTIEISADGTRWDEVWSGGTALTTFSAALEYPLDVPLRFPFEPRQARFVRLRQTGSDDTFYWSISRLRVFGD